MLGVQLIDEFLQSMLLGDAGRPYRRWGHGMDARARLQRAFPPGTRTKMSLCDCKPTS